MRCQVWFASGLFFFPSHRVSVYHTPLSNRQLILMTRSSCLQNGATFFLPPQSKVTRAFEYAEAPLIPSQGTPSKHPRGACVVTHLHCEGGTVKHKQRFLWVIHISRTAGRNSASSSSLSSSFSPLLKGNTASPSFVSQQESSSKQFEDNSHQTYGKQFY